MTDLPPLLIILGFAPLTVPTCLEDRARSADKYRDVEDPRWTNAEARAGAGHAVAWFVRAPRRKLRRETFARSVVARPRGAACRFVHSSAAVNESGPEQPADDRWVIRLCWAFVLLGLLVRLVRFLVVYPIWHDEAFLAVNFLDRGYRDLLRPLEDRQVAPHGYLWIELTAVRLFGFSEWSLRLFATICGLASVLVFRHLAARLLRGLPLLLAVAIFAVAFHPIRHSAEIKPYASDLLASLIMMTLAVEWWRFPDRSRWLWVLAAVTPVLLVVSYPAVLVGAVMGLALASEALWSERRSVRLAFLTYNLVLAGSFFAVYFSFTVVQSSALLSYYRQGWWRESFPPLSEPWQIPFWLISVHTGTTMAYPVGEKFGGSTATFLLAILGGLLLWRSKQRAPLRVVMLPFVMGLVTACLGRYPYGGPPRVTQYLVPSIVLLTGLGAAGVIARSRDWKWGKHSVAFALISLAGIGSVLLARDLIHPYRVVGDRVTLQLRALAGRKTGAMPTDCASRPISASRFARRSGKSA